MAERHQPSDEELLLRLEAAALLLAAARTRYRALVPALQAWGWKERLRAVADIAREVARTDSAVLHALERATRRAEAEAWPKGEARTLLHEVSTLRAKLCDAVERRLERAETPHDGLPELLSLVVGVPRKVPMNERDAAAQEALQADDELIPALERFGKSLQELFGRPLARGMRLPFTLAEYDALLAVTPEGTQALSSAWARVSRIDLTGGVERDLHRRAKRASKKGTRGLPGPRALVHATFWNTTAAAHQQALLAERFAPLQLLETERTNALRFLLAREGDGAARLEGGGPRAALLMLAHELTASPHGRAPLQGGRTQVGAWAAEADALGGNDDWRRLRDGLRALAGRSVGLSLPPLYRVGKRSAPAALPERLTDFFSPGG